MFTIVIPVFNHARYLLKAVGSCLASPLVKEILMADDGSQDDSARIIEDMALAYPGKIKCFSEKPPVNRGAHARLNQLCRLASSQWIAVLNSDDYFPPGRFELLERLIRSNKCDFVAGGILIVNENDEVIGTKRGILEPEYPLPFSWEPYAGVLHTEQLRLLLCNQNFLATTSNMVFTRELFHKIGGFGDLRYSHDWLFALQATMLANCLWTPNFITCYRTHQTNTIKEKSPHIDGEITRFMYRFLEKNPKLELSLEIQTALLGNRHFSPFWPAEKQLDLEIKHLSTQIPITVPKSLTPRARINALLALYHGNYDYIVISASLQEPPKVTVGNINDHIVFTGGGDVFQRINSGCNHGAILRLPGEWPSSLRTDTLDLIHPCFKVATFAGNQISGHRTLKINVIANTCRQSALEQALISEFKSLTRNGKPAFFVFPVFMAVGGVERNTVEVIRGLRNDYNFLVITTERHSEAQGSIHYQLDQLNVVSIDLAEIADATAHFDLIKFMAGCVTPALVWLCNASPWQIENAGRIRRLFADTPIVDQTVYDTEAGWIEYYNKKEIQSFDRFIAINQRIHKAFISKFQIPGHRVDLIYPMVDVDRIPKAGADALRMQGIRDKLGISSGYSRVFAFVGRLSQQKRPLFFLEVARMIVQNMPDVYFIMIGDGPLASKCDCYITENKLTNHIKRIPNHPNPPEILGGVDGLLITSEYEGLPIAMLEALLVGLPVLSTDVGDISLILEQYKAGVTVSTMSSVSDYFLKFLQWNANISSFQVNTMSNNELLRAEFSATSIIGQYDKCFNNAIIGCKQNI